MNPQVQNIRTYGFILSVVRECCDFACLVDGSGKNSNAEKAPKLRSARATRRGTLERPSGSGTPRVCLPVLLSCPCVDNRIVPATRVLCSRICCTLSHRKYPRGIAGAYPVLRYLCTRVPGYPVPVFNCAGCDHDNCCRAGAGATVTGTARGVITDTVSLAVDRCPYLPACRRRRRRRREARCADAPTVPVHAS